MNEFINDIANRIIELAEELNKFYPSNTYDFAIRFDELGKILKRVINND